MIAVAPPASARLPAGPGVYRFRDERGSVLYIGRAVDLSQRVRSYWRDCGDRPWLERMVPRVARIEAVSCDSAHEAAWLERNLLEHRRPRWNRAIGGNEVPVAIRVDTRRRSAGLSVVHLPAVSDGARYFGPYLGGSRVRQAAAALGRVLPVAYASEGLDGTVRDFARVLGVGAKDHHGLLVTLIAVLERDHVAVAAVLAELVRRRDDAARDLAFEQAARLQAEIGAVKWIVADQNVAMLEPLDLDVCGWAEGVLVSFEIRAGRLSRWRQRRCSGRLADALVSATPAHYRDFADRNAALAVRLTC